MRAICIVKCQKDRIKVFEVGKEYDIDDEMLKSGFFKRIEKETKEKK